MSEHFYYTLTPYCETNPYDENAVEIDLNTSSDFSVLFKKDSESADLREFQKKRLAFIGSHTKEFDLIAQILHQINAESQYTYYDLECLRIYHDIVNEKYGKYPVDFFRNRKNWKIQRTILHYLVQKSHNNKRQDYYEAVLNSIFQKEVNFYYDKLKKVLYVSFIAEGTEENRKTAEICQYFFADLLLNIRLRWRNYPLVIDRTDYAIASEGEQLCGTIV